MNCVGIDNFKITVQELSERAHTAIEVKSAFNGKVLCKRYQPIKHAEIGKREVSSIWAEIRSENTSGFSSIARPVLCVYVHGDIEYRESELKRKGEPACTQD